MNHISARILAVALALAPAAADRARTADTVTPRACFLDLASLARRCPVAAPRDG